MEEYRPDPVTLDAMSKVPMIFRNEIRIPIEGKGVVRMGDIMEPFQKEVFQAKDPALKFLAGVSNEDPKYTRFWTQRARGNSKTTDEAINILWLLTFAPKMLEGAVFADDEKQAGLLHKEAKKLIQANKWLLDYLDVFKFEIKNKHTGSMCIAQSSDVSSSWGLTLKYIICDELTHWSKDDLWNSVISTFAKQGKYLGILCNAGIGRNWQWDVRESAQKLPGWYFHSLENKCASWITEETLAEQRELLPKSEYERLWLNKWQDDGGNYLTEPEVKACRDPKLIERVRTQHDGWVYIASIDYAEKTDRTVGTVMHQEGDLILVDRMDVICPKAMGHPTKVSWVEQWMQNVQSAFGAKHGAVFFVIDRHQLVGTRQKLQEQGFHITEFEFASGTGNYRMATVLRQMILQQRVRWYEGCGQIYDPEGAPVMNYGRPDNLETELVELITKHYSGNQRYRFDHTSNSHDDRAYSLASGLLFFADQEYVPAMEEAMLEYDFGQEGPLFLNTGGWN